jgi:hypothetical protein
MQASGIEFCSLVDIFRSATHTGVDGNRRVLVVLAWLRSSSTAP